ncbi:MAG: ribonuclease III [Planctomycetota bacterium]|nr:ribonuclease III [Planctomycetota bacterium]
MSLHRHRKRHYHKLPTSDVLVDVYGEAEDVEVELTLETTPAPSDPLSSASPPPPRKKAAGEVIDLALCEKILGYTFRDRRLLVKALTHSSSTSGKMQDNERLEFFGDAVLDMVVREYLFLQYPDQDEGALTETKSALVCRPALARIFRRLNLRRFLRIGRGLGLKDSLPESLQANTYEAVVAAIYLDGGYPMVRDFILQTTEVRSLLAEHGVPGNAKSLLQRKVQHQFGCLPLYRVVTIEGPEHACLFEVAVLVDGVEYGRGRGPSKKAAQQMAAQIALDDLELKDGEREQDLPLEPAGNRPASSDD